jgi:ABC-type Na+ efflux pump permease subunit
MPSYFLIPWLLVVLSVALVVLIYWGSLVEERRNRRLGR